MNAVKKLAENEGQSKRLLGGLVECHVHLCRGKSEAPAPSVKTKSQIPRDDESVQNRVERNVPRPSIAKKSPENIKLEKKSPVVALDQRPADLAHLQNLIDSKEHQIFTDSKIEDKQAANTLIKKEEMRDQYISHKKSVEVEAKLHSAPETIIRRSIQNSVNKVSEDSFNLFFRARSDERLYSLGESFYSDYKKGQSCFGFANLKSKDSQKRSVLGVASFIKYFEENSILVLTDKLEGTFYDFVTTDGDEKVFSIPGTDVTYRGLDCHGVVFIEVSVLASELRGHKNKVKSSHMRAFLASFDLILCDLPEEEERKNYYDVYLPILQALNHVTLTISLRKSRFSEVDNLKKYFSHYKIPLKGSVIEDSESKEKGIRV